jgi:pyruvate dehydrogenase E1 component beta subunit
MGNMVPLALRAAADLEKEDIDVEVIDPRTLTPLDRKTICDSVMKTQRLVVADPAWLSYGAAAEIIATVSEHLGERLKANPMRITLPDSHTPMSMALEEQFYPSHHSIVAAVNSVCRRH